jgi:two-component system LytT family sensor kinase
MTIHARVAVFVALQLGAWSIYAALKLRVFPLQPADAVWIALKGIALSSIIAMVLMWWRARGDVATIAAGVLLAPCAGWVSLELSLAIARRSDLMRAPGTLQWLGSAEAWLFESLLYLAWVALYLGLSHAAMLHAERRRLQQALAAAQEARIRMLRYQVNPHFLFNALTSLRALVMHDAPRARTVIGDLAGYLRHTLQGDHDRTSLRREFEGIGHFLAVQRLRFATRLDYRLWLDPAAADVQLPPLLLQPLVENAIKYGMQTGGGAGTRVSVQARRERRRCVVEVHNSGRWIAPGGGRTGDDEIGIGIGVENVRRRLAEQLGTPEFTLGPVGDGVLARIEFDAA